MLCFSRKRPWLPECSHQVFGAGCLRGHCCQERFMWHRLLPQTVRLPHKLSFLINNVFYIDQIVGNSDVPSEGLDAMCRVHCDSLEGKINRWMVTPGHPWRVRSYQSGKDEFTKERARHAWMDDTISATCATIAFGMGIDKPNVRYCVRAPCECLNASTKDVASTDDWLLVFQVSLDTVVLSNTALCALHHC